MSKPRAAGRFLWVGLLATTVAACTAAQSTGNSGARRAAPAAPGAPGAPAEVAPTAPAATATTAAETPGSGAGDRRSFEPPSLPASTKVLHFGCSSASAIAPELERQLGARGIRVVSYTKEGTHLPLWGGRYSNVPHLMRKHDPDLVLINLGGNDAVIADPSDRVESIQRLVSYVRHKPCVWIGPSMWRRDNGVLAMIRDNAGPCRYFDTDAIVPGLPRDRRDPIHPSIAARKQWTQAIVAWLEQERDEHGPLPFSLRPTSVPP